MTGPKVIDLGALIDPARQAGVSIDGAVYPVKPITAKAAHRVAVANESGSGVAVVEAMTGAAREAVLTMPDDVFAALTMDQVGAIVAIANQGVDAVERLIAEKAAVK